MSKSVRRLLVVLVVVAFVPWLAAPIGAHADGTGPSTLPSGCTPSTSSSSGNCYVDVASGPETVPLGQPTTVTFTCDVLTGMQLSSPPGVTTGCYGVQASLLDATTGQAATIVSSQCGGYAATPSGADGSLVDCATVASPICPVGFHGGGSSLCSAPSSAGATPLNQASITFTPTSAHQYLVSFTGLTPSITGGSSDMCPSGMGVLPGTAELPVSPSGGIFTTVGACRFGLQATIYAVKVTSVGLSASPNPCGGAVTTDSSGAYYGPPCFATTSTTGTVQVKVLSDLCTSEPANGTPVDPSSPLYPGVYACTDPSSPGTPDGALYVTGVPENQVPITFTAGGPASWKLHTSGSLCTGDPSNQQFTSTPGAATLCPIGAGSGSFSACYSSTVDTQPPVCSSPLPFNYTQTPTTSCIGGSPSGSGGNEIIPQGASCVASDISINHDLIVQPGASLTLVDSTVNHDANLQGAGSILLKNVSVKHDLGIGSSSSVSLCGVSVNHDVTVQNLGPGASLVAGNPPACAADSFGHDVTFQNIQGTVRFSSNTVGHDASFQSINGGTTITGNHIGHNLTCGGNTPVQTASGNMAGHSNTCGG